MSPSAAVAAVPIFLQYGALGLLALVLLGMGVLGWFFLSYLKELVGVMRSSLGGLDSKLDRLIDSQERTVTAVERSERANVDGHHATQNQLLMIRGRSPSPYPR